MTVHKPMLERLLLCDYAVAHLTTGDANANELGVRYAVRSHATVLICAGGERLPFDVALADEIRSTASETATVAVSVAVLGVRRTGVAESTGSQHWPKALTRPSTREAWCDSM